MAILLNGSTQRVDLPAGLNIQSLRPWTWVALVDTSTWASALDSELIIMGAGDQAGNNGFAFGRDNTSKGLFAHIGYSTTTSDLITTMTVGDATGWWLITVSQAAADANVWFTAYRYSTSTLSRESQGGFNLDMGAPGGTDKVQIGAHWDSGGGYIRRYPGAISWVGMWADDLTNKGALDAPARVELTVHGPWNLLNNSCKFFMPFSNAAFDLVGGVSGTLVGSPSYVNGASSELRPPWWMTSLRPVCLPTQQRMA
jgi:hypothetical protein